MPARSSPLALALLLALPAATQALAAQVDPTAIGTMTITYKDGHSDVTSSVPMWLCMSRGPLLVWNAPGNRAMLGAVNNTSIAPASVAVSYTCTPGS